MFYPQSVIIYQWRSVIFNGQPNKMRLLQLTPFAPKVSDAPVFSRPSPAWWPTVCRSESSAVPVSHLWWTIDSGSISKLVGGLQNQCLFAYHQDFRWMNLDTLQILSPFKPGNVSKKNRCISELRVTMWNGSENRSGLLLLQLSHFSPQLLILHFQSIIVSATKKGLETNRNQKHSASQWWLEKLISWWIK